ncbi:aminopeptidase P family protein [Nonomuraea sp. KC401]|uniref:M24 family metallopeptidase n=1 Tax=unclassified Nonomuraea TaxID=2593643 RepID=UPI0010FF3D17|nr:MULTISPECIES: Xaa-Pro peptidase family protein [unclassified Nonomuraea]NBE94874.1 M24 family metallopeptidase [Nonomuraea sp. K271]TLF72268.1 aminopeptidase P family protein [Nonomuraea sp. KC401]
MTFSHKLPDAFYAGALGRVRAGMSAEGLAAMVLDDPLDVAYLTGFHHFPNERPVACWLPLDGDPVLLVPDLEREYAADQGARAEIVAYPEFPGVRSPFAVLSGHVPAPDKAAYALSTSVARAQALAEAFPGTRWAVSNAVGRVRLRKLPEEIALHEEAARIADAMIEAGVELVRAAVEAGGDLPTETELASHVISHGSSLMYARHTDVVVVPMLTGGLVYGGPNSAQPHRLPGGDRLRKGETFMLSLGCAVGGRFVESERTFVIGEPTTRQARYYETVREAQETGTEALVAGVTCEEANRRCLRIIEEAGLAEHIRHRQGHGIGLGFHEPPWLSDGDATELAPGMILSSEPGVYVPGHAGYRISDTVLVTETGPRRLTAYPRELTDVII